MARTFEQVKSQVGTFTVNKAPAAWYVGTDETLEMRDRYFRDLDAWRKQAKELAEAYDCRSERIWVTSGWGSAHLTGFTPNDPSNVHKALRLKTPLGNTTSDIFVPNKRTKAGKELNAAVESLNSTGTAPSIHKSFSGYRGRVNKPLGDGRFLTYEPTVWASRDKYPVLVLGENPDDNPYAEDVDIDPTLWERVPALWFLKINEEE